MQTSLYLLLACGALQSVAIAQSTSELELKTTLELSLSKVSELSIANNDLVNKLNVAIQSAAQLSSNTNRLESAIAQERLINSKLTSSSPSEADSRSLLLELLATTQALSKRESQLSHLVDKASDVLNGSKMLDGSTLSTLNNLLCAPDKTKNFLPGRRSVDTIEDGKVISVDLKSNLVLGVGCAATLKPGSTISIRTQNADLITGKVLECRRNLFVALIANISNITAVKAGNLISLNN